MERLPAGDYRSKNRCLRIGAKRRILIVSIGETLFLWEDLIALLSACTIISARRVMMTTTMNRVVGVCCVYSRVHTHEHSIATFLWMNCVHMLGTHDAHLHPLCVQLIYIFPKSHSPDTGKPASHTNVSDARRVACWRDVPKQHFQLWIFTFLC